MAKVKYALLAAIPALTLSLRIGEKVGGLQGLVDVTLTPGDGTVSKEEFDALSKHKTVLDYVSEGDLRFPGEAKMEKLYGQSKAAKFDRMNRLSAIQEDRKNKAAEIQENGGADNSEQLDSIKEENKQLKAEMAEMADAIKALQDAPPASNNAGTGTTDEE